MEVIFHGNVLDHTAGVSSYTLTEAADAPENVRELIGELGQRFGAGLEEFLLGDKTCLLLVNGRGIMLTGGMGTLLKPGDTVTVLPFVDAG